MKSCSALLAVGLLAAAAMQVTGAAQQKPGPAPGESLSQSYRGSQNDNVEYQKVPPIKVFDNLYYVGPGEVSVWLIPTTDGLVLIDSSQEPLVDHVLDSIRKSGFDPRNIRYILLTHGHLDHFGGAGKIKAASAGSARVAALEEDWNLIENTYKSPGRGNQDRGVALMRDMVLREGQTLTLGKTEITVYKMPGHTPGSASFAFTVYDNGRPHKALVFGGPGQRNGVEGGTQFLESIRRLKREFADVEVPVHVHSYLNTYPVPGGGAVFEPAQKLAQRKPGQPHPFVDNAAWRRWLDVAEAGTIKYIEQEKLKAQPPRSSISGEAPATAQTGAEPLSKTCRVTRADDVELQKIEPFKVFDNLYYVGPCYVSVWLVTTPQGHILFDSAQEPYVDHVIASIKKVGINLRDIEYIILSHGHLDHVGGAARLQEATGARVVAVAEDWTMIEALDGRTSRRDPRPNRVPKRDMVVKDGDTLTLGNQTLKFHQLPGHTPGVLMTEGITVYDGSRSYKAVVPAGAAGGPGLAGAEQGVRNANKLAAIQGVQVNLQIHSWAEPDGYPGGGVLERAVLLKNRKPGDAHPFVDPATWNQRAKAAQESAAKTLAAERAKAATAK